MEGLRECPPLRIEMCVQARLADGGSLSLLIGDAGFEVLGDAVGFFDDCGGVLGWEDFVGGFGEEGEPAREVVGIERELEVGHHRVAFVASGGEQHGGPEVLECGEMMRPVADDSVEDGAYVGVEANLGVEGVDQGADLGLGDLVGHGYSLAALHRVQDVSVGLTRGPLTRTLER